MSFEIGVISDTHGLLRVEAINHLKGVDAIIHAGDIGDSGIIDQLNDIAPFYAIKGNVDQGAWAKAYPDELRIELAGNQFYVIHNIKTLTEEVLVSCPDVIICGHSHKPRIDTQEGILVINPGSAGPRRFKLPICLAKISITEGKLSPCIIDLVFLQ